MIFEFDFIDIGIKSVINNRKRKNEKIGQFLVEVVMVWICI